MAGESASIYLVHIVDPENAGETVEDKAWVSDVSGKQLRAVATVSDGTVLRQEMQFNDIQWPQGVQ